MDVFRTFSNVVTVDSAANVKDAATLNAVEVDVFNAYHVANWNVHSVIIILHAANSNAVAAQDVLHVLIVVRVYHVANTNVVASPYALNVYRVVMRDVLNATFG